MGTATYNWPELKKALANGANYRISHPFCYRYQLRIKITPSALIYTFWDGAKCLQSQQFVGPEQANLDMLSTALLNQGLFDYPCVGVSLSVWSSLNLALKPEKNTNLDIAALMKALREQPQSIKPDLQNNGIYVYTAFPFNDRENVIVGIPVGHPLKDFAAKLPESWSVICWPGPLGAVLYKMHQMQLFHDVSCHSVLTKNLAAHVILQNGHLKFIQQDRLLTDSQLITEASMNRLQVLFQFFNGTPVYHYLHPVDVDLPWVTTLKSCLQDHRWAQETQILHSESISFPNLTNGVYLQDMFPLLLPS